MTTMTSLPIKAQEREHNKHVYFRCCGYGVHIHIGYGASTGALFSLKLCSLGLL